MQAGHWAGSMASVTSSQADTEGFPGGPVVKSPPANARDTGSIPVHERLHMLWDS